MRELEWNIFSNLIKLINNKNFYGYKINNNLNSDYNYYLQNSLDFY
jgi:hypothetical protein